MTQREEIIAEFLTQHGWEHALRQKIKGDASFRRYERLIHEDGDEVRMAILMDAPPITEDVRPFVAVAKFLREHGLNAPEIYAQDQENGLLLLEDLKIDSYALVLSGAALLSDSPFVEIKLYKTAADVLTKLHGFPIPEFIQPYDNNTLMREVALFTEWYLPYRNVTLTSVQKREFGKLWYDLFPVIHQHKPVFVCRDYHADNLMWLKDRQGLEQVGLLDFQDALAGSPAYDLVSMLEDARREVNPAVAQQIIEHFLTANPHLDRDEFLAAYAVLGAQRNMKIIGIFTRLAVRDDKKHYLDFLPRVWEHLYRDLEHPALKTLKEWVEHMVPEANKPKQPEKESGLSIR